MNPVRFDIAGSIFSVQADELAARHFSVRSVPRSYDVHTKSGPALQEIERRLAANPANLLLVDQRVYGLHLSSLVLPRERLFLAPATEDFKSLSSGVIPALDWLAERGLTKGDTLLVVGGGIIQDVGAFAACVFKRGVPWVFFPTTLLAQCDSCIGGKTGVNHGRYKNQAALFSAPREVVLMPEFLDTLAEDDIRSGLGEVLKLLITGGPAFVERYEAAMRSAGGALPGRETLAELAWLSLLVKKSVVEADEFELSVRRSMNYGHTVGHALETLSGFTLSHGKAVLAGICVVNRLAEKRGVLDPATREYLERLALATVGRPALDTLAQVPLQGLRAALGRDKKNTGSSLNLVVISEPGKTRFLPVENDEALSTEIAEIVAALAQ